MKIATKIDRMLKKVLDDREATIIRMRFGICPSAPPQTLEEVAEAFNLTRERIRQIENKALEKIQVMGKLERFPRWRTVEGRNPVSVWLYEEKRGGIK